MATAATVAAVAMRWGKTVLNYESANKYAVIARRLKIIFDPSFEGKRNVVEQAFESKS